MAVRVIPAKLDPNTRMPTNALRKRRVAAYARVSTLADEQANSYENQVEYYTNYINARADWEFVGIYTDKGISGTNTFKRVGFNNMIKDALDGKIDLIITKAVTRFARNTVDTLETTRKLREKGVEIYFEEQNVYTFDSSGELMLTILASMGQEESRNISENVKWGKRKKYADGQVVVAYHNFLGYDKHDDPKIALKINEEEAKIIRRIYSLYMSGKTPQAIAKILMDDGIKSPMGKDKWRISTVLSILKNEKYKGDALVQKTYVPDFKTHKPKKNNGEMQQYYQENHHEPIIPPHEWDLVQVEMERRKGLGYKYNCTNIFTCKLVCGECGGFYGAKVWHSNDKYRKVVFQCNHKYDGDKKRCETPVLKEDDVKRMFIDAYAELMHNKSEMMSNAKEMIASLTDTTTEEKRIEQLNEKANEIIVLVTNLVEHNSKVAIDQDEFQKKYNAYDEEHKAVTSKIKELQLKISENQARAILLNDFIETIDSKLTSIDNFDEDIWNYLVEKAVVNKDKSITFHFRNGQEITKF